MLLIPALAMYAVVALGSNQSVPEFYISHFAFDQLSAYYRVLIWRFGSASALAHPLFGVGMNEWERPTWMPPSIDMFWLIHAVRYGLVASALMLLAFLSVFVSLARRKGLSDQVSSYRMAFLISLTSIFIVGWTVHFWNATYTLVLFILGSGVWMLDADRSGAPVQRAGLIVRR